MRKAAVDDRVIMGWVDRSVTHKSFVSLMTMIFLHEIWAGMSDIDLLRVYALLKHLFSV
jgi:hypothetical protein